MDITPSRWGEAIWAFPAGLDYYDVFQEGSLDSETWSEFTPVAVSDDPRVAQVEVTAVWVGDEERDAPAAALAELMAHNVTAQYGASRFPNMDVCAKSGTAEVGGGKAPHAWFAGFLRNPDAPYAFVVLVENGGSGADAAGSVAARVLDAVVNGY